MNEQAALNTGSGLVSYRKHVRLADIISGPPNPLFDAPALVVHLRFRNVRI